MESERGYEVKRFFDLTFRPFFVLFGAGTAGVSLYAFWPQWAAETIGTLAFVQEYTIIVQHWGIMVGLMGVFMIAAGPSSRMADAHTDLQRG